VLIVLLVAAWIALAVRPAAAAAPTKGFDVQPVPAWVSRTDVEAASPKGIDGARGGLVNALLDDQIRVGATVEHYSRIVRRVLSTAGVENGGEITIEVDPSYERLVLHRIEIVRGAQRIDVLRAASVHAVPEEGEAKTYSDRVSEAFVLPDVRIGDVIDCEYSVNGQNPVFGGRLVDALPLVAGLFTERLRVRLLAPADRAIASGVTGDAGAALETGERVTGGLRESTWERRQVEPAKDEGATPDWFEPHPWVRMSEFASWADVVVWGVHLFEGKEASAGPLAERVVEIKAAHPDAEGQALAALDFVQNQIRYLGIETGEHSHLPHDAAAVFAQRFGDCKDKSLLLVTLLRALGIEARVALANPGLGEKVADRSPSPLVFSHAIVRIRLAGKTYFVDPTISHQGGSLEARGRVRYGHVLVLAPGTTALEHIPDAAPARPTIESRSVYGVGAAPRGATLEVETTYRDEDADTERGALEETSRAELQKKYTDFYAGAEASIRAEGDLVVLDDVARNVLVVREHYVIPEYWSGDQGLIEAISIRHMLHRPSTVRRTMPLRVPYPLFVRDVVEVHFPRGQAPRLDEQKLHSPALTYARDAEATGTLLKVTYELRTHKDSVAPDGVADHVDLLGSILDSAESVLTEPPPPEVDVPWTPAQRYGMLAFLGAVGLVGIASAAWKARYLVRRRSYRKSARLGAGETAAQAVAVKGRADAERTVTRDRCSCGSPFDGAATSSEWGNIRLGDSTLDVVRLTCGACGRGSARYFRYEG